MVGAGSPYAARGEGYQLWDDTGRALIDANNNFTALVHGHAHPEIVNAALRATRAGASFGLPNVHEIDHAERLVERLPHAEFVRYTNSGTEAVMAALRIARAHTGRPAVILARGAYHGTTDLALAAGGLHERRGVPDSVLADALVVPLNDLDAIAAAVDGNHERIAAVLIDLLPNRLGLVAADPQYVGLIVEIAKRFGIVIIVDEVISFRLRWDGWSQEYGLAPDLSVLGKLIGGGFPVGAVVGRRALMEELDPRRMDGLEHGGTFTANPVTLAAGAASLDLLDRDAITRLNRLGEGARSRLEPRLARLGWAVRGCGSLVRPAPPGSPVERGELVRALWWAAYERGALLNQSGLIALSTPMDEGVVDELIDIVAAAAEEVANGWRRVGADAAASTAP
jgi:glutamate-1-semialdehyde 2,1-aminomutase